MRGCARVWVGVLTALCCLLSAAQAVEIVEVRSGEHADYTRLVLELDGAAGYHVNRCGEHEVVVSIDADMPAAAPVVLGSRIRSLRFEERERGSVARIELDNPALRVREMLLVRPHRIVIDVEAHQGAGVPLVSSNAPVCGEAARPAAPLELHAPAEAAEALDVASVPEVEAVPEVADPPDVLPGVEEMEAPPSPQPATREVGRREHEDDASRISDQPAPLRTSEVPRRPFTLELGDAFLGRGIIGPGFELPTGAVWQPSLLLFGTSRVAVQGSYSHEVAAEAVGRLDLFANLKLSGTERILVGIRPLDRDGKFTGYTFRPGSRQRQETEFNARIRTLFFEGDVGELFPILDRGDSRMLDFGFSVGRQPMNIQEGMLVDDTFDAVGLVRNNILPPGASNLRITALYGWDQIHRGDNTRDRFSKLYALLTSADLPFSTVDLDLVYVESQEKRGGDGAYLGLSSVQRLKGVNTALRATGSLPIDGESAQVGRGALLFGEVSWTPPKVHDLLYLNAFWGIGDFTSAARAPDAGGPLGRTGILFAASGLGSLPAPLGNDAKRAAGGALGYQMFLGGIRRQLVFELGGRRDTLGEDGWAIGAAARFQQAVGQHHVLQIDLAVSEADDAPVTPSTRIEWRMKF
jgi:hypothetical protein